MFQSKKVADNSNHFGELSLEKFFQLIIVLHLPVLANKKWSYLYGTTHSKDGATMCESSSFLQAFGFKNKYSTQNFPDFHKRTICNNATSF